MSIDLSKVGFFYQTAYNPCAVEMNLRQIKKHYLNSPIIVWEDISNLCEDICKKYNVSYKKVYRLSEDLHFHQSQPITEVTGGLRYLNRMYISCITELKEADWIIHYEDDVWCKSPIKELPETEWSGCFGELWDDELLKHFNNELGLSNINCYHGACGGTIIFREAFINAYLKIQDINWMRISKMDKYVTKYSDAIMSYLLLHNKCKWSEWKEWSQGGYEDFKIYDKPIIHNIKYWYRHNIEDLKIINNKEEVKFFLENNS